MKICKVEGCPSVSHAMQMCKKHYLRRYKGNDIHANTIYDKRSAVIEGDIAKIPLGVDAKQGYAIVDKEFARIDQYKRNKGQYPNARINGKTHKMHRIIMGDARKGAIIDHIDRNTLNNTKRNLRIADKSINAINTGLPRNNKTGCKGVRFIKRDKKYCSQITVRGVVMPLGRYEKLEDAIVARKQAELKYFGFIVEY